VEKKKYAKWKAADILNAINSGLRPTPGGYGEVRAFVQNSYLVSNKQTLFLFVSKFSRIHPVK
jgi:hypothetical protein